MRKELDINRKQNEALQRDVERVQQREVLLMEVGRPCSCSAMAGNLATVRHLKLLYSQVMHQKPFKHRVILMRGK